MYHLTGSFSIRNVVLIADISSWYFLLIVTRLFSLMITTRLPELRVAIRHIPDISELSGQGKPSMVPRRRTCERNPVCVHPANGIDNAFCRVEMNS
jgi:hypothetical protein